MLQVGATGIEEEEEEEEDWLQPFFRRPCPLTTQLPRASSVSPDFSVRPQAKFIKEKIKKNYVFTKD
jgi:hypothetical protein